MNRPSESGLSQRLRERDVTRPPSGRAHEPSFWQVRVVLDALPTSGGLERNGTVYRRVSRRSV